MDPAISGAAGGTGDVTPLRLRPLRAPARCTAGAATGAASAVGALGAACKPTVGALGVGGAVTGRAAGAGAGGEAWTEGVGFAAGAASCAHSLIGTKAAAT